MAGDSGNKYRSMRAQQAAQAERRARGNARYAEKSDVDAGLNPQQLKTLAKVEADTRHGKVERLTVVDGNGTIVFGKTGTENQVGITRGEGIRIPQNAVFTHNHPGASLSNKQSIAGRIGTALSAPDMITARAYNAKEMRAVSGGYTYSFKRGPQGWNNKVSAAKLDREHKRVYRETAARYQANAERYFEKAFMQSKGNPGDAFAAATKALNEYTDRVHIIAIHKANQAMAKLLGARYTRRVAK